MTLAVVPKPPTDAEFLVIFNRLAVALREQQDESGITQGVYYDALKDLPLKAVELGATALMKEADRRFFPTTAEWRTAAERAHLVLLREAVQPARREPWHFDDDACGDTGWQLHECDGSSLCGRTKPHTPHDYVTICPCRPTNRTFQRHRQFGAGA